MNAQSTSTIEPSGVSYQATVVSNKRITPETSDQEVRELVLDVNRTDTTFKVGQSLGVLAPGSADEGEEYHFRQYSLSDVPVSNEDGLPRVTICVLRCITKDAHGGEYHGVTSNYLCDMQPGDTLRVTGPVGIPYDVPEQLDGNLVMIGTGTGIAPFRAFVKHLYRDIEGWTGRVWLFYGGSIGLEKLYMNDKESDLARYLDEETFEAFEALSPKPNWADPLAWDLAFAERGSELWDMMANPKTYVYVAGQAKMSPGLDAVFSRLAGSSENWMERKAKLMADKRWVEVLY